MKKNIWLTCGIPGSGKSTWINNMVDITDEGRSVVITKDQMHFSFLDNEEPFLDEEKEEVFNAFVKNTQQALADKDIYDIFIYATNLTKDSREKILKKINLNNADINLVYFNVPLETCLNRNVTKTGCAYIPPQTIKKMYNTLSYPTTNEINKWRYSIFWVDDTGTILTKR